MKKPHNEQQAVAIKWNPLTDKLPTISASGEGELASEILRLAAEYNIPIRQDNDLLQVLSLLDVGESIPAEAHTAVAEILAFIYWTNQQYADILGAK
ncbi:MAG: EscU/YscU/HrcU family type III secretion system export apparatus switch protein [Mariprofundales bacterium]|nr:EscU/YscU/HrcU family type III secretion system export apparatus switch protein [Mariprofundales bacterium]